MFTQEQIEFYRTKGYLRGPKVLSDDEVDALREALQRVIEGRASGKPVLLRNMAGGDLKSDKVVVQIVNIWQADEAFRRHIFHPAINEMAARLAGAEVLRVWHDQIQYKPPEVGTNTDWHQDLPAWPCLYPDTPMLTAWVALDDVDEDNGCMRFVPGSHHWGVHQPLNVDSETFEPVYDPALIPEEAEVRVELVPVAKGVVNFHHALTWHGSAPNRTQRHRRAIAVHYMPAGTRFNAAGNHPMKEFIHVPDGAEVEGEAFPITWPRQTIP